MPLKRVFKDMPCVLTLGVLIGQWFAAVFGKSLVGDSIGRFLTVPEVNIIPQRSQKRQA